MTEVTRILERVEDGDAKAAEQLLWSACKCCMAT